MFSLKSLRRALLNRVPLRSLHANTSSPMCFLKTSLALMGWFGDGISNTILQLNFHKITTIQTFLLRKNIC